MCFLWCTRPNGVWQRLHVMPSLPCIYSSPTLLLAAVHRHTAALGWLAATGALPLSPLLVPSTTSSGHDSPRSLCALQGSLGLLNSVPTNMIFL